jgi:hypothetical protein
MMDTYSNVLYTGYFHSYILRPKIKTLGEIEREEKLRIIAEEKTKKVEATEGLKKKVIEDDKLGKYLNLWA